VRVNVLYAAVAITVLSAVRRSSVSRLNSSRYRDMIFMFLIHGWVCLQCFDAVGWVAGRASGL